MASEFIRGAVTIAEAEPFKSSLEIEIERLVKRIATNLSRLQAGPDSILEDVLSDTAQDSGRLESLSDDLIGSLIRVRSDDRLSLRIIRWLHEAHAETVDVPAAFCNAATAVLPYTSSFPPLYYLPSVEQRLLLYQPMLFHEFGHVLYAHHRDEMDDLVGELQEKIQELLLPASERDDKYAVHQASLAQQVATTWYGWAQEFFCDAVGFEIGGPAFLRTFSMFLGGSDADDFYAERDELAASTHPLTCLRVKLLAERATRAGYRTLAEALLSEWATVAAALAITEDYHGYYVPSARPLVEATITDMLVETSPRSHEQTEAESEAWNEGDSPITLVTAAWSSFVGAPDTYSSRERDLVERFLAS
jgi:hypothetical protein